MKRKRMFSLMLAVGLLVVLGTGLVTVSRGAWTEEAVSAGLAGTAFTYQGRLTGSGSGDPVAGPCDFRFTLYASAGGADQVGSPQTKPGVALSDGYFAVDLDFGAAAFNGKERHLKIEVDCGGGYVALSPRAPLRPAPYALALPGLRTEQNPECPNVVGGQPDNSVSPGVAGATIGGGGGWAAPNKVTDNWSTVGGGYRNQAGNAAGSIGDASGSTVAGGEDNEASGLSSTVGGGFDNTASAEASTVAGGKWNQAPGTHATVGGGVRNVASGEAAVVAGGGGEQLVGGWLRNTASGDWSTVGGGGGNTAQGRGATVAGGGGARLLPLASTELVTNTAGGDWSTIGGGGHNRASGNSSTVGGGWDNEATGESSTVGGGTYNVVTGTQATVGGGGNNRAENAFATIAGGTGNAATGYSSAVGGGEDNFATGTQSAISGGYNNQAGGGAAAVGGGASNVAGGYASAVGGGLENAADADHATVSGGHGSTASGAYATVPGGQWNSAEGAYSFAAGWGALAEFPGSFVWAGAGEGEFASMGGENSFTVYASGGVWMCTNPECSAGVFLEPEGNEWLPLAAPSDRNLKQGVAPVDELAVLSRLAQVPISTWSYNSSAGIRHMGPMAQDFYAAFGLGQDDKHIGPLDASGVALAAIQGLYRQNRDLESENAALRQRVDDLDARLAALERRGVQGGTDAPWKTKLLLPGSGLLLVSFGLVWLVRDRATRQSSGGAR